MKLLNYFIVSLCLFIVLGLAAFGETSFPSPSGFVNDYAGVLAASEKQELTSICTGLKQKTGAELAVAIVKTVAPLDSKLYAVKLFEKWKIGEKGKDNGVLILLALEEKRIEIEVGYGMEGLLPDSLAGQILDEYAIPYFKEGKLGTGLVETARQVSLVMAKEEGAPVPKSEKIEEFPALLLYVIIGIIVLGVVLRRWGSIVTGIVGAMWGYSSGGMLAGAIMGALFGFFFGFWGAYGMRGGFGGGGFGSSFGGFSGGSSGGGGSGRGW